MRINILPRDFLCSLVIGRKNYILIFYYAYAHAHTLDI